MAWDKVAADNFRFLIGKVPVFLRDIAEKKVGQTAEALARGEGRTQVTEKDMVDAFFAETPFGFHGPMKCDMEEAGVDYKKYGHGA